MLNAEKQVMTKDLHRQGVSISEITRRAGHGRKTVRAVIYKPLAVVPAERTPGKIAPFLPYLEKRVGAGVTNAYKPY